MVSNIFFRIRSCLRAFLTCAHVHPIPFPIKRIGTEYGGWHFAVTDTLNNSSVVSCGAGEDISFDIGLASAFNTRVLIVDPTPRAVEHINLVQRRFGLPSSLPFSSTGLQFPESYDLTSVTSFNITHAPFAVWNVSQKVRFFEPADSSKVSHSIINFKNKYRSDTSYFFVDSFTLSDLLCKYSFGIQST